MAERVIYIEVPVYPSQQWSDCPNQPQRAEGEPFDLSTRHDIQGGHVEIDGRTAWQEIDCLTCGLRYTEVYAASHRVYPVIAEANR